MRASSKSPRVESSSGVAPPPPSSTGDTSAEASVDPTATVFLHLLLQMIRATSDDLSICRMLETVMTVQAANGQLLVDMLDELRSLQANFESLRRSPLPPPFDDES